LNQATPDQQVYRVLSIPKFANVAKFRPAREKSRRETSGGWLIVFGVAGF